MNTQGMHPFEQVLHEQFGGVIRVEEKEGAACALEAASVARGHGFSDDPDDAGLPTLWPLSDGYCIWPDDQTRTKHIVPVVKALWGWPQWSRKQKAAWKRRVAERTVRELLPLVLRPIGLESEADFCVQDGTEKAALDASAAAEKTREAAFRKQDAILTYDAIRAREAAEYAVKAVHSKDVFYTAHAAHYVAIAVSCMARGPATAKATSDTAAARYKVNGFSALDILARACRIWREEAERVRQLRSN